MNKKIIGIFIMMLLIALTTNLFVTSSVAEETFLEYESDMIEGSGYYFEVTNSSYLNITLSSSEEVNVIIFSHPKTISYTIERNCSANSSLITLTGFEDNTTYYRYQDGNLIGNFTVSENGSYAYSQDLIENHHIVIRESISTIYILPDGSVWADSAYPPCTIIRHDTNEYWLTANMGTQYQKPHRIVIQKSDIVLDGKGFYYNLNYNVYWGDAIYMNNVDNVTIKNFSYIRAWGDTIWVHECTNITIENITFRSIWQGVLLHGANNNPCDKCVIKNCIFDREGKHCIRGIYAHNTIIDNVTCTNYPVLNGMDSGMCMEGCYNFLITNCTIENSVSDGIIVWKCHLTPHIVNCTFINNGQYYVGQAIDVSQSSGVRIINNTITGHIYSQPTTYPASSGILLTNCGPCRLICNNINNNDIGIYIKDKGNHIIRQNTIRNNSAGIFIYDPYPYGAGNNKIYLNNFVDNNVQYWEFQMNPGAITNIWKHPDYCLGNYWSDYTGDNTNGDGVGDTMVPHPYYDQGNNYFQLDNYPLMDMTYLCGEECPTCNNPPLANANGPYIADEGSVIIFNASGSSDPDNNPLQYRWDFNNDGIWDTSYSSNPVAHFTWYDEHSGTAVVEVYDGEFTNISTSMVTVNNVAPTADLTNNGPVDEGSPVTISFINQYDPGTSDTFTYSFDLDNDGTYDIIDQIDPFVSYTWYDNGINTVKGMIKDNDGGYTEYTTEITVNNVAPTITSLCLPIDPLAIGVSVDLTASFTDPGILDSHTATIDWGDGNNTYGCITGSDGTYNVSSSWIYNEAGVYTITLTVEDDDGGNDTEQFRYIVVYDPSGGFVTGGGWINSPIGAYKPDINITGKANFGFVSKYKQGQSTPMGNTEFNFKMADLNFHSKNYDWLVVAGAKAMYKGTGTINNEGSYKFILTAIDEDKTPSIDTDMFRIKIWEEDELGNEIVIYDNNIGDDDFDADPETYISNGNIVIHNK